MKVIIAGSRTITSLQPVARAVQYSGFPVTEIVSGGARGVDRLGEGWAEMQGIPIRRFIPDWELDGRRAGLLRNTEMARYADALVAIWDGKSRGTADMITKMQELGKPMFVLQVKEEEDNG